jgi:nitrilase
VIGVSPVLRGADVPAELRGEIYRDATAPAEADWMSRGLGTIVAPGGDVLAGPLRDEEGIVVADIDVEATVQAHRRMFDPVGHYARPDVFHLSVDARRRSAVDFETDVPAGGRGG